MTEAVWLGFQRVCTSDHMAKVLAVTSEEASLCVTHS